MLNIEPIIDDAILYMQRNFAEATAAVMALRGNAIPLPVPRSENYFIGEPSRYRPYQAPCVFVVANKTARTAVMTIQESGNIEKQVHYVDVSLMLEETNEERLTRASYRYAEIAAAILTDADITTAPDTPRAWSTKCRVLSVDYGMTFAPGAKGPFRKDVVVSLGIIHWDAITPLF